MPEKNNDKEAGASSSIKKEGKKRVLEGTEGGISLQTKKGNNKNKKKNKKKK